MVYPKSLVSNRVPTTGQCIGMKKVNKSVMTNSTRHTGRYCTDWQYTKLDKCTTGQNDRRGECIEVIEGILTNMSERRLDVGDRVNMERNGKDEVRGGGGDTERMNNEKVVGPDDIPIGLKMSRRVHWSS